MTLERITEIPRPLGITDVKGVVNYLGNLATTLQDHMSLRPEDYQTLVDGFSYSSTTHALTHSASGTDAVSHNNLVAAHNLTTNIDHASITNTHNLTTAIDHNAITNTHNLTTSIDHDATTNFVTNEHLPGIDEDLMTSNSAVHVPTQQSVKAYVDNTNTPVGSIIAWLGGYFTNGSNGTYTRVLGATNDVAGANGYLNPFWYVCDGAALNDADSPIWVGAGRYLPNLTDDRFIMGSTVAGGIGGSSTMAHTHTVDPASVTSGAGSSHGHGSNAKTSGAGSAHGHGITGAITAEAVHTHAVAGTSAVQSVGHVHAMAGHTHGISNVGHTHGGVTGGIESTATANGATTPTIGPNVADTSGISASHTHTFSVTSGAGASHTHAHTLATANESAHTHGYNQSDSAEAAHTHAVDVAVTTSSAASDTENRPKFLTSFMIVRIK